MASKPSQRSLKHLRGEGWIVAIVEKWIPPRGKMKFGVRRDVWGFGDLLACRAQTDQPDTQDMIALVQCCSTDFSAHKQKILAIPEFEKWKAAGGEVILHGWAKRGPRGKRKTYQLREEFL